MNCNQYQKDSSKTIVDLDYYKEKLNNEEEVLKKHLLNASAGISVESAEVLQSIQRYVYCGKDLNKDHIVEECGDVLWYISYLLTKLGVSLEECLRLNLTKVIKRYPERFYK